MLVRNYPQDTTTIIPFEQLILSINKCYDKFTRYQAELNVRETKPTLREDIILLNSSTRFEKLKNILKNTETITPATFETWLQEEWVEIKNTYLSYTSIPDAHITQANCAIATYLGNIHNKPSLTYLIPTLKHFVNLITAEDITELPLQHVLKTHICSDDNETLISISLLTYLELNSADLSKFFVNPYFQNKPLSENEITRLKNHSILTDQLISAYTNYNAEYQREKDQAGNVIKISLKRALEKLINGLRAGGARGGRGGLEKYAEMQAYNALARFRVYWKLLTDEQKSIALAIESFKKILEEKVNKLVWTYTTAEPPCVEQLADNIEKIILSEEGNTLAAIGLDESKQIETILKDYADQFNLSKKDLTTVVENHSSGEFHYTGTDKLFLKLDQIKDFVATNQIVAPEDVLLIIHELQPEEIKNIYPTYKRQIERVVRSAEDWIGILLHLNEKQVEMFTSLCSPNEFALCVTVANVLNETLLSGFLRGMKMGAFPTLRIYEVYSLTQDYTDSKVKRFMDVYDYQSLNFHNVFLYPTEEFNKILPILIMYTSNSKIFADFYEKIEIRNRLTYQNSFDIKKFISWTENVDDVTYFYKMFVRTNNFEMLDAYCAHVLSILPTLIMTIDDMVAIFFIVNTLSEMQKFLDYMLENISHITGDLSKVDCRKFRSIYAYDPGKPDYIEKLLKIIYLSKAIKNREQFENFCTVLEKEDRVKFTTLFTIDEIAELTTSMEDAKYFFSVLSTDKIDEYYAKVEYLYMRNSDQPLFVFENLYFVPESKQQCYIEKNIAWLNSFMTNFVCQQDKFIHFVYYMKILSLFDKKYADFYCRAAIFVSLNDYKLTQATQIYIIKTIHIDPTLIQFKATDLLKFPKESLQILQDFPMSHEERNECIDLLTHFYATKSDLSLEEIRKVYQYLSLLKKEIFLNAVKAKMHALLKAVSTGEAVGYLISCNLPVQETSYYFYNMIMERIAHDPKQFSYPEKLMNLIEDSYATPDTEASFDWADAIKLFCDKTTNANWFNLITKSLPEKLRTPYFNLMQNKLVDFSFMTTNVIAIISVLNIPARNIYIESVKNKFTIIVDGPSIRITDISYVYKTTVNIPNPQFENIKENFYDKIKVIMSEFAVELMVRIKNDITSKIIRADINAFFSTLELREHHDILYFKLQTLSIDKIDIPLIAEIISFYGNILFSPRLAGGNNINEIYGNLTESFQRHKAQLYTIFICMIILEEGIELPFSSNPETDNYLSWLNSMNTPTIYDILKNYKPTVKPFLGDPEIPTKLNRFIEFFQSTGVRTGLSRSMSIFSSLSIFGGKTAEQAKFCNKLNDIVAAFAANEQINQPSRSRLG